MVCGRFNLIFQVAGCCCLLPLVFGCVVRCIAQREREKEYRRNGMSLYLYLLAQQGTVMRMPARLNRLVPSLSAAHINLGRKMLYPLASSPACINVIVCACTRATYL